MKLSISIPDDYMYALELEAAYGRRSVSSTALLYLTSSVALSPVPRPGHGVGGETATVAAREAPGVVGLAEPHRPAPEPVPRRATPMSTKPRRTGLCEHRVPADSHCRKCDR